MAKWRIGQTVYKDPNSTSDFVWDFAPKTNGGSAEISVYDASGGRDWLPLGESIASATTVIATGITEATGSRASTSSTVNVRLSGGTIGTSYNVTVRITTTGGSLIVDRSVSVSVRAE